MKYVFLSKTIIFLLNNSKEATNFFLEKKKLIIWRKNKKKTINLNLIDYPVFQNQINRPKTNRNEIFGTFYYRIFLGYHHPIQWVHFSKEKHTSFVQKKEAQNLAINWNINIFLYFQHMLWNAIHVLEEAGVKILIKIKPNRRYAYQIQMSVLRPKLVRRVFHIWLW